MDEIKGTINWNNQKSIHYVQDNNAIEKYNKNSGVKGYLETCGPSSACICMSAMYGNIFQKAESLKVQPEDLLFINLLNPFNFPDITISNRFIVCYPKAIFSLFGVTTEIKQNLTFQEISNLTSQGNAVQFAFYKPSHFNAIVAYDVDKKTLLRVDPWPKNPMNKKGGFLEELTEDEFNSNVKHTFLIYKERKM